MIASPIARKPDRFHARLWVVPSRDVGWGDLAAIQGDVTRLIALADPTFALTRELGLIGWAGCPWARMPRPRPGGSPHAVLEGTITSHKIDGRYQLTLWITDRAVCSVCGYAETLEALHARLGLGINVDGPTDGSDA